MIITVPQVMAKTSYSVRFTFQNLTCCYYSELSIRPKQLGQARA
jgi:hypothetical protein